MLYFCERPASPQSVAELEQWRRVLDFREAIDTHQLWWTYKQVTDFERLTREHLTVLLLRSTSKQVSTADSELSLPLRVFLCHSSLDKPSVRSIYRRLERDGFTPWLDEEDLLPGQDWDRAIQDAIRKSDAVVVCLSTDSTNRRGYLQKEIQMVLDVADEQPEGHIFLIPARLEECDVPARLQRWQWVDLFTDQGYQKLRRALSACAMAEPNIDPKRLPVPMDAAPDPLGHSGPIDLGIPRPLRLDGMYVQSRAEYAEFIRFFSDDQIMTVSSTGDPEAVSRWLVPELATSYGLDHFELNGDVLKFDAVSSAGTVEYRGTVSAERTELHLHSRSLINGHESYGVWRFVQTAS
jgi:hypothetical protein